MHSDQINPVTEVLRNAVEGNTEAARELLPQVYEELRNLAKARLKRIPPGNTLQATALVHEAYMRLVAPKDPGWQGRAHFFAAAARAMRDILVDQARHKAAERCGGGRHRIPFGQVEPVAELPSEDILAVADALKRLETEDRRKAQIADLRFFARMNTSETAEALGVSRATVWRDWRYIRAWLERELRTDETAAK